ncbi:MAG TPA: BTAD domain-containing putative transcriptional regulator [Abditibacteriaceae bacterium]|jgi:predicted ATPase/DNA-binding SARP family transcriptional activator
MAQLWRIELFGGLRAHRLEPHQAGMQAAKQPRTAPQSIERFASRQAGALLAFLTYYSRPHDRDILAEVLWPEHDPQHSRAHLRVVLSSLRRMFEPDDVPGGAVIVSDRNTVGLNFENVTSDVAEFEASLQSAAQDSSPAQQNLHLMRAVDLYNGALLPGYYEEWIVPEAQRLEELYFAALRRVVTDLEDNGQAERALLYAKRGVSLNALREDLQHDIMRLCVALGRPALALRQYREFERALKQQLNTSPGPRLRELRRRIEDASEYASQGDVTQTKLVSCENSNDLQQPPAVIVAPAASSIEYSSSDDGPESPTIIAKNSLTGDAAQLPPQWTRFFGRKTEIGALQSLWCHSSARLVTLTGPGGSGKTRLALETARLWREQWQPEITLWFVPLAEVSQPDNLAAAIAEIVGGEALWPGSGQHSALERLLPQLQAEKQPVLLLDNIEHLLPTGAALVQALLQRVPALRIFATSRQPLEIAAETVFEVPLMPVPRPETPAEEMLEWESIQLFHDRARLVCPSFKISKHNAATVRRLCCRLEGWPLAIEFCAAHATNLAPWQMLQRLEHRLDFLSVTSAENVSERHSTLRVMLKWSYDLLWPELRQFFAGLSVFRGGTPEAAAIVTNQPHASHFLHQLHAASLVKLEADGRFSMLETVREFAREQLSQSQEKELQHRHAACFLEMVRAAMPDLQATASQRRLQQLQRLKLEHDNFRTALEWSLEHEPVMALHLVDATSYFWADLFCDAHNLAEQALEKAMHLAPPLLVSSVLTIAGIGAGRRGDYCRQSELARQRLELACQLDDDCQIAWAWFHVGTLAFETADHVAAERAFLQALQIFRARVSQTPAADQTGELQNVAWTLNYVAMCAAERHDWEAAERCFVESSEIFCRIGDQDGEAGAFAQRGDLARRIGDLEAARRLLEQSAAIQRNIGDTRGHPWRQMQWGRLACAENRSDEAGQFFCRALNGFGEVKDLTGVLNALLALACLDAPQQPSRAVALLAFEAAQREKSGLALPDDWLVPRQQSIETVRAALSEADFQATILRGNSLKLEQAVELAAQAAPAAAPEAG